MSLTLEQAGRIQRGSRIILGTGLQLDQNDDGATILSVAPGISSIGVQDGNSGPDAATRLIFQGNVVSVTDGIATFDFDSVYQAKPPAGYSWVAGSSLNTFATPYGSIQLGPANSSYAHIYSTLPFYFNQQILVNGTAVSMAGHTHAWSQITSGVPVYATRWPTTAEIGLSRFVNAPVQGNSGPYGSVRITGSEGSYAGIQFADAAVTLMVYNAGGVLRQGFYRYTSAPTVGWEWYFENGALTVGTVPWDRLTGVSSATPTFQNIASIGQILLGTFAPSYNTGEGRLGRGNDVNRVQGTITNQLGGALNAATVWELIDRAWTKVIVQFDGRAPAASLFMDSAGKIGFGNSTPQYQVHVTGDLAATGWIRSMTDGIGLYNQAANYYWYADSTRGRWISRSTSGIELYDTSNIIKGTLLFTSAGFGLSNSTGTWSVRCNPGADGGQLYGNWLIDGPGVLDFGVRLGQMIDLYNSASGHQYGIGIQISTQYFRTGGGFAWFKGGSHATAANDPGGGGVLAKLDASGNFYAKQFLDIDDPTNRFLDPSGTSQINFLNVKGDLKVDGALTKLRTGTTYDPVPIVIISNVAPTSSDVAPYGALWLVI